MVTLSHAGYIKSQPLDDYRAQKRGGRGKQAAGTQGRRLHRDACSSPTPTTTSCASPTRAGSTGSRSTTCRRAVACSRGKPIVNMLPLTDGEKINALLPVKAFDEDHYVFMATAKGIVKKTPLSDFSRPRPAGIIAVGSGRRAIT